MSTSITVVCYKSKKLSNGNSPLMLRITKDRKLKYLSLGISIETHFWDFERNINDENFGSLGNDLNMWKFHNHLTESNKSSYIDSFLDRSLNATEIAKGINNALHGDEQIKWNEEEVQVKSEKLLLSFP